MAKHLTAPLNSKKLPGGIPYIIGNEVAERFSFYGMKGILMIFMTKYLLDATGQPDYMTEEAAKGYYHLFTGAAYFFPLIGSLLSDIVWGKYRTILILSLGYCLGHACLAMGDTGFGSEIMSPKTWLLVGLIFIAIGAGGIKPCVSAHVGDQFGSGNKHMVSAIFSWFYFSINVGAATSTILTPILLRDYGPWAAFGLPGILMALATFTFWLGRNKFVHIPPQGLTKFKEETFSPDGMRALRNLAPIFLLFIPMFWAVFDQTGSAWVLQADKMDRQFGGIHWLPSQIQAVNPILILILIPTFSYILYPFLGKFFKVTPLRKISIGLFLTAVAFSMSSMIESKINGGEVQHLTSQSAVQNWSKQGVLDGDADGYGWASSPADAFPHEITIRLRERIGWDINQVQINPYAWVGPVARDEEDAYTAYKELSDDEQAAADQVVDQDNWAKHVVVLVRDATAVTNDAEGKPIWTEVGAIDLQQENALQTIDFASSVRATHVKLRVDSNWGGDRAKLGEVRVNATGASATAAAGDETSPLPDVASVGYMPSIGWQFLAYILLTAAEVMVSITSLEFAYTQAPKKMKSFIMGIYFLGVSLGNFFTAAVNWFIINKDGTVKLEGADYYWFFTALMAIVAVIFVFFSLTYKGQTFIQGEDDQNELEAESEAEGIGNV